MGKRITFKNRMSDWYQLNNDINNVQKLIEMFNG